MIGKRRIAFLLVNIYEIYQSNIWPGVVQAAEELGYDLFLFPGFEPNAHTNNERQHNIIYSFLTTFPLDGFIIASNNFGTYNTQQELEEFIRPFSNIPHVCIGTPLGNAPTIKVDQKAGLKEAIEHLIKVHGLKNFAYIRGPLDHPEANIRYQTFLDTLNRHNIPFDKSLLYTGNFLPESGEKAIEEWIDQKNRCFDAVVAANDLMAIAALNALEERGISVPDDVAVLGFDNMSECRYTKAPLTTVSQPLSRTTYEAVQILNQMLEGKAITRPLLLPTKAVIRRSCGCFSSVIENIGKTQVALNHNESQDYSQFAQIIAGKYSTGSSDLVSKIEKIIQIIVTFSHEDTFYQEFIKTVDNILVAELENFNDLYVWNDIFNEIFEYFSDHFQNNKALNGSILMQKVRVYIGEMIERRQAMMRAQSIDEYRSIYGILQQLSNALEKEKIAKIINERLYENGIAAFFLLLYDKTQRWQEKQVWQFPEKSFLFAGFTDNGKTILTDNIPFPTVELVKSKWLKDDQPGIYVIQPLFFEKTHMGYMIAEMGPKNGLIYESLRAQLSSSLLSSRLFEENKTKEQLAIKKSEHIQSMILPMLDSINQVSNIAVAKVKTISQLVAQTEQSSNKLLTANESVERIAGNAEEMLNLISIIDDISMRINLLSINASIQSARAGVHGRGFAIIASTVRKLADSTAMNAKQTEETLKKVVENVHQTQSTSEESVVSFKNLKKEIIEVSNSLTEISKKMEALAKSSQEIFEIMK